MYSVPGTWAYVVMPAERSATNINMNGEIGDGRKMRLIDADLYRASLEKTLAEMEKAGDSQTDIADGVRRALRMLDMQPDSADVAPVVHGETSDFYNMIQALDEKSRKIGLTEKERLEKLIYEGLYEMQGAVVIGLNGGYGMLADYLMSEGVIVPPCKVGDKAWIMLMRDDDIVPARVALIEYDAYTNPHMWIGFEYEDEVGEICLRRMRVDICYGKRAFRTRGAAELERRKNET